MKTNILLFCLFLALFAAFQAFTQAPTKVWDKTIGGSSDDFAQSIINTSDGGFVIAGYSSSGISGDKTEANKGKSDFWIVKLNSSGQKVWDKTIGGSGDEQSYSIIATTDGGFVVAGASASGISGDKTEASKGSYDYWIVKLNSSGQKVWDKTIGGNGDDAGTYSIIQTTDGGFVIAGSSTSGISGDKTEASAGYYDYWIVKLNSAGMKVWDKTLGGDNFDLARTVVPTTDGGFVIVGLSYSGITGNKTEANKGMADFWVVKLNSFGQKVWDKTIGGSGDDGATSVIATPDGGFVVTGSSSSGISGDKTEASKGLYDYWIVKLNSSGQKLWDKTIGGSIDDFAYSCIATSDGGFVIAGYSSSGISGDKSEINKGMSDYWIVKLNSSGQKVWDKTIGGNLDDYGYSIITTSDGSIVVAGQSLSGISVDKSEASKGLSDYWIVKLGTSPSPTTFDSATSGNWNASSTWTCNCIPDGTLPVRIMSTHIVTVPTAYTGLAKGLRFISTGKVTLQGTGKVNVSN